MMKVIRQYQGHVDPLFRERMVFYCRAIPIYHLLHALSTKHINQVQLEVDRLEHILMKTEDK